jgi:ATP-binding cassette subfamily B protein
MSPSPPAAAPHTLQVEEAESSTLKRLDLLIGDKRGVVGLLAVVSVINATCEAIFLASIAQVAASLVGRHHGKNIGFHRGPINIDSPPHTILLVAGALALVRLVLQWPLSSLPARISADVQAGLRKRLFRAYVRASWEVQSRDREGTLQETMSSQASQATGGALQATTLVTASLNFLIVMAFAVLLNPLAAALVMALAIVTFLILKPMRALGARRARELSAAQVRYAGGVAEANRAAEETHVFGVGEAQLARISEFIDVTRDRFYRSSMLLKLVPNVYQSMIYLLLVTTMFVIDQQTTSNGGSIGAVVLLLVRGAQTGGAIQATYQGLQQSLPFIDRLENTGKRYTENEVPQGGNRLAEIGRLGFENVSFAYNPGRPVLEGVTFEVAEGEAIGIVGPSGAGKSTLVQLLLQLRPPGSGRYLVNGQPLEEFSRDDWYHLIAYVPQEPRLLHATVADNIRFYRDISEEEVEWAAKLARIHEDITTWSSGYETVVGPRADAVSGGQQQRICLARALAGRPRVLVLDEPTSALDPNSESLIQESLTSLRSELTMFTVAHRISTLDICDRVMVILDGRLVAFDTRAQLKQSNDYYRRASTIAAGAPDGLLPELR